MNTRSKTLRLLIGFLLSAGTAAFGQTQTLFWTGVPGTLNGNNIGVSTNWSNGTTNFNSPTTGSLLQFNNTIPGPLTVYSVDGIDHQSGGVPIGGGFGASGVAFEITPSQTGSVTLTATNTATGMGFNSFIVDAGAPQFILGDNLGGQLICTIRPSGGIQGFTNNSSFPVLINPGFQIQNGGGNQHEIDFWGSGNFAITNNLRNNNTSPANILQFFNTGTNFWTAGGPNDHFNDGGFANVTVNNGSTVIIYTNGLLPIGFGSTLTQNGLLEFNAVSTTSDTLNRAILGAGNILWNGGTWTLTSGASTYSGSNILMTGELVANGTETPGTSGPLGFNNIISFQGGTLGYGPNNNADYSARFDTTPNQIYNIDTGGQNVTYATGLSSVGGVLTKTSPGTLTLAGSSTYTGQTTISAGNVEFAGTKIGTANITVADGAGLGVTDTGTPVTPGTLSVGSSSGATLNFDNINNILAAPLAPNTLSSAGTVSVNVNSGNFVVGGNYPLFSWTVGTPPPVALGFLSGALGNLFTNAGNTAIELNITALADNWNGTNGGNWSAVNNWVSGGVPATYADPIPVVFSDSATGTLNVTNDILVQPKSVIFNNNTNAYTLYSTAGLDIGGNANVTKNGTNTVTMVGGANSYTNITTINNGVLSVSALADGGSPSDIGASSNNGTNLVFNGGVLQYTGAAVTIDRSFSVGTSGGGIDASGAGALNLSNTTAVGLSAAGGRFFTLTGTSTDTNTLSASIGDRGGSSSLTKNGSGKWVLLGNNSYSGVTVINGGEVQVGNGGGTGSLGSGNVTLDASLDVIRTGTLTISGAISGGGGLTNDGTGTLILANNSTYTGGTTINSGVVQVGNGGATGSLATLGPIVDNSLLIINTTGNFTYNNTGVISGTGNVIVTNPANNGAIIKMYANNTYTGWTIISTNATLEVTEGAQGAFASSVVTNFGTLRFVRQDQAVFGYSNTIVGSGRILKDVNNGNPNDVTLTGTNSYTGGTFIAGGAIILGDGVTPAAGTIVGNVVFTNSTSGFDNFRSIIFNRPDSYTFSGNIIGTGGALTFDAGQVVQNTASTVTLTGNNTYLGGTVLSNGTLVVASSIGSGPVSLQSTAGSLTFSNATVCNVPGNITGTSPIVMVGSGLTTLSGVNTNSSSIMTASNGILAVVNSSGSDVDVSGGTFAAGGFETVNTVDIQGNLNINSGTVSMSLNTALAQSNSFVLMTNFNTATGGGITNTGGSLQLINVGPTPAVGDRFVLFSEPVIGGATMTITTVGGFAVDNNLAFDGSVTVASVALPPPPSFLKKPKLLNGTNLVISATNNAGPGGSWDLVATNNIKAPVTNWPVVQSGYFNTAGSTTLTNPVGTNATQFFILRAP